MLYIEYGIILSKITKNENKILNFLYGFLLITGINQIILTPCILLHTSFSIAFYTTLVIDFALVLISFKIKDSKTNNLKKGQTLLNSIVCLVVVVQMILITIAYKQNADDSFYVSLSTGSIDSKAIYMEEPSMGYSAEETLLSPTELLPTIELQIAIYSKIANVNPAIMCHSILPMIMIFIAYLAFYQFAKSFMDEKNAKIFLIILSVIFLFTGFSTKFRTGCLLIKPWQGKAILLNIGIPIILACLIRMDKNIKREDVIILAIANLFSMSLSSTAIFLVPFIYLAFGILKLIKWKWKDILWLIISFIPIILYVLIYINMNQNVQEAFAVPKDEVSIIESLKDYNSYIYLIYYVISTIIIMIIGNAQSKRYFGYVQLINLVTIWNPIFSNIIAKYFTSSAIFWRVLWLLPIEFAIAYSVVLIIQKNKNEKVKIITAIIAIIILIIPGKFVYKNGLTENLENIPQYIINQTNYILEKGKDDDKIVVFAVDSMEPSHSTTMRQISSKIELIFSRGLYIDKVKNKQIIEERRNLIQLYSQDYRYTIEEFNEIVKKQNIDWMIIKSEDNKLIDYLNQSCLQKDCEMDGYTLYRNILM